MPAAGGASSRATTAHANESRSACLAPCGGLGRADAHIESRLGNRPTPLYAFPNGTGTFAIAYAVLHCTLGDGVIAAVSLLAALVTRTLAWPIMRPTTGLLTALAAGITWTIWAEWRSVYITRAWAYGPDMPTIGGVGVSPLLQWMIIPPIVLLLMRVPSVLSYVLGDGRSSGRIRGS